MNVIIRTYRRPNGFNKCYISLLNQTYKGIRAIVGCQELCPYFFALRLSRKAVSGDKPLLGKPAPYNLHLNELNTHVKEGWVMYLDDDDMFVHDNAVQVIMDSITSEDDLLIWKVKIKKKIVPSDRAFGKAIIPGDISGIGFAFHSKHLPVDWGCYTYGDYRVITELASRGLKIQWIDQILTRTQGRPGRGTKIEL